MGKREEMRVKGSGHRSYRVEFGEQKGLHRIGNRIVGQHYVSNLF
jgi:hypothetical protein